MIIADLEEFLLFGGDSRMKVPRPVFRVKGDEEEEVQLFIVSFLLLLLEIVRCVRLRIGHCLIIIFYAMLLRTVIIIIFK